MYMRLIILNILTKVSGKTVLKNEEIEKKLEDLCKSEEPTMLYIHIPFCEQLVCSVFVTDKLQVIGTVLQ